MSEEQLKAFLEKVKGDINLQEKLKAATNNDAVVAIAKVAGFSNTTEDLNSHRQNLTDDELEGAAGGGRHLYGPGPVAGPRHAARLPAAEVAYTLKAPALAGAFYFFNHPKKIINQPSISGTIERRKC